MITENLSTLQIHKLTQAQYDRALAAGNIDENALYLTPDEPLAHTEYASILPETTLTFTETGVEDGMHLPQNLDLKAGATYLVKWNGTEYPCECTESGGNLYLGNASYAAVDDRVDGEPFLILKSSALPDFTDVITNVTGNHTLSVVEEVVHKIDEKYLPETPYVTLEMFGGAGDGVTINDDAFEAAMRSDANLVLQRGKTYLFSGEYIDLSDCGSAKIIYGNYAKVQNLSFKWNITEDNQRAKTSGVGICHLTFKNILFSGSTKPIVLTANTVNVDSCNFSGCKYCFAFPEYYVDYFHASDCEFWNVGHFISTFTYDGTEQPYGVFGDWFVLERCHFAGSYDGEDTKVYTSSPNHPTYLYVNNCLHGIYTINNSVEVQSHMVFRGCHFEGGGIINNTPNIKYPKKNIRIIDTYMYSSCFPVNPDGMSFENVHINYFNHANYQTIDFQDGHFTKYMYVSTVTYDDNDMKYGPKPTDRCTPFNYEVVNFHLTNMPTYTENCIVKYGIGTSLEKERLYFNGLSGEIHFSEEFNVSAGVGVAFMSLVNYDFLKNIYLHAFKYVDNVLYRAVVPITEVISCSTNYDENRTFNHLQLLDEVSGICGCKWELYDGSLEYELTSTTVQPIENLVKNIGKRLNLNDEVYEYGYINKDGGHGYWNDKMAFRTVNYLPVVGGRTIEYYMGNMFDGYNTSWAPVVKEYNAAKEPIAIDGAYLETILYAKNDPNIYGHPLRQITLNEETAYIRFYFYYGGDNAVPVQEEDFDNIQLAYYYIEDDINEYIPYDTIFGTTMVDGSRVVLQSPDGTPYVISVSDDGTLATGNMDGTTFNPILDVPTPLTSDNGKFLSVVDGSPVWATPGIEGVDLSEYALKEDCEQLDTKITDNCNQLDERIDYVEGLLNQTVSYVDSTNGYFRYAKRHGMVFVATTTKMFAGDNIVKMAVWTEVDSIPQECAPNTDIYFNATLTSSANRLGIVRISWDGKIYLYSPSADCDACWGYFTYPARGAIN